ncbi:UNVERIFIED_CONTAM: hypothetical protein FKN15_066316 [Acipenser sinensis]
MVSDIVPELAQLLLAAATASRLCRYAAGSGPASYGCVGSVCCRTQRNAYYKVRTDQPHSKEVSEMEAARISPELPIRWVVFADRTVEIKEEVTELQCDQSNERILKEETPPLCITERGSFEGYEGSSIEE